MTWVDAAPWTARSEIVAFDWSHSAQSAYSPSQFVGLMMSRWGEIVALGGPWLRSVCRRLVRAFMQGSDHRYSMVEAARMLSPSIVLFVIVAPLPRVIC
ncbi:hypothetical protein [Jiangella ureilytica]|uniref:hypothetical protein n=1 Tax=Jiangella ureilytica TaxID=2530374 RepID=UPI0013A5DCEA|nr:hypothetical protein [Jiangella ureilytica]